MVDRHSLLREPNVERHKVIDGHYLNSFVIWNDFDPRGTATWGYSGFPMDDAAMDALPSSARLEYTDELILWMKLGLVSLFPRSFLGRSFCGIRDLCQDAYNALVEIEEGVRSELPYPVTLLESPELFARMAMYVDPFEERPRYFAPDHSVRENLPDHFVKPELPGFTVCGHCRYVLVLDKYTGPLSALLTELEGYHLSVEMAGRKATVQCWADTPDEILQHANHLKKIAIRLKADHYEPCELGEVRDLFYRAMPGGLA